MAQPGRSEHCPHWRRLHHAWRRRARLAHSWPPLLACFLHPPSPARSASIWMIAAPMMVGSKSSSAYLKVGCPAGRGNPHYGARGMMQECLSCRRWSRKGSWSVWGRRRRRLVKTGSGRIKARQGKAMTTGGRGRERESKKEEQNRRNPDGRLRDLHATRNPTASALLILASNGLQRPTTPKQVGSRRPAALHPAKIFIASNAAPCRAAAPLTACGLALPPPTRPLPPTASRRHPVAIDKAPCSSGVKR